MALIPETSMRRTPGGHGGRPSQVWSSPSRSLPPGTAAHLDLLVEAINDTPIEAVRWAGSCSTLDDLRAGLRVACHLASVQSIEFLDEDYDEWAEALDLDVIPRASGARLRLRGWRVKGPAEAEAAGASFLLAKVGPPAPPPARAELTLEGDLDTFDAAGGTTKFAEEMGELLSVSLERIEVINVRAGSVIVTFKIHACLEQLERDAVAAGVAAAEKKNLHVVLLPAGGGMRQASCSPQRALRRLPLSADKTDAPVVAERSLAAAVESSPTPQQAIAHLQSLLAAPSVLGGTLEVTQLLSKTRPRSLIVLETAGTVAGGPGESEGEGEEEAGEPSPISSDSSERPGTPEMPDDAGFQMRRLDLGGLSSDDGSTTDTPVQLLTPRAAVPSSASAAFRDRREATYGMIRFYTERAEPMLVQRYRSDEMVLRRWYTEHPAGIEQARQWGESEPVTDQDWDVKIGEIIDGFLAKEQERKQRVRERRSTAAAAAAPGGGEGGGSGAASASSTELRRASTSTSDDARAVFTELDKANQGWLPADEIAEVLRQLGLELTERQLEEAVAEMSSGGLKPPSPAGSDSDSDSVVEWAEFDCWFRLQQAIDGLEYPELMYATYIFEQGDDPRQVCRGGLPNMVSIPPEQSYREKLAASKSPKYDYPHRDQVYKDVPRTFSTHPQFAVDVLGRDEVDDETGRFKVNWREITVDESDVQCGIAAPSLVSSLQNVLMAVVAHSPNGYTQGMNYVAATLLLHRSEEEAFDWLCRIVELYPGLYAGNLWGTRVETGAIETLLAHTPVGEHMAELGVSSQLFTTAWILPLFCSVMQPLEPVTTQVLQHLIALEGRAPNTRLARMSLALFKIHEASLLATRDAGELMELVPRLPTAFGSTPQGVRKRLVGMLALAQSDTLVSDALIVAERSQQRREVASEARRRRFMQETLATCKKIEADEDRQLDLDELLGVMRSHVQTMQRRADRKVKHVTSHGPKMSAVVIESSPSKHTINGTYDRSGSDSDAGTPPPLSSDGDGETSLAGEGEGDVDGDSSCGAAAAGNEWETHARSLFDATAEVSKADAQNSQMAPSTLVTMWEFCALCEKLYRILEPADGGGSGERGGAAVRPWLSAPSAAELEDIAEMEGWLTSSISVSGPAGVRRGGSEPEPEPGDAMVQTFTDAMLDAHSSATSPVRRVVEADSYLPQHRPRAEPQLADSGWFGRWRCCATTVPPPVLPPALAEDDAEDETCEENVAEVSEGVPPL